MLPRRPRPRVRISNEIPPRSITIKAARRVMKEQISKDADFLCKLEKRVPVTRTSRSEPPARRWGHRNQKFSQGNGPSKKCLEAVFCFSEVALFRKNTAKHQFSKQLLKSCVFRLLRTWGFASENQCLAPFPFLHFLSFLSAFELHSGPSLHDLLSETCQSRSVFV